MQLAVIYRLKGLALILLDLLLLTALQANCDIRHLVFKNRRKSIIKRRALVLH